MAYIILHVMRGSWHKQNLRKKHYLLTRPVRYWQEIPRGWATSKGLFENNAQYLSHAVYSIINYTKYL